MANDNEQKKIDLTPVADIPVVDEFADKDLDTTGVEIHTDEGSAAVSAVEADYGADQIQILEGRRTQKTGGYLNVSAFRQWCFRKDKGCLDNQRLCTVPGGAGQGIARAPAGGRTAGQYAGSG